MLSVSIGETNDAVAAFVARYGLDYQFLMDRTGEISAAYEVSTTPTTYFIAPDGTIADKHAGVVTEGWLEENIADHVAT